MNDLKHLMRDHNPFAASTLSDRAKADEREIVSGRRVPRAQASSMRRKNLVGFRPIAIAAFAVIGVLALGISVSTLRSQPAAAVTPDPLELRPTSSTVESLREELTKFTPVPQASLMRLGAEWEEWSLLNAGPETDRAYIQPQRVSVVWHEGGSGTTTARAGEPMSSSGDPLGQSPPGAAAPGAVLERVGVEIDRPLAVQTPPIKSADMRSYLGELLVAEGIPVVSELSAAKYLNALASLLQTWTLSQGAQAAAVDVILSAPGVDVAGATTDRAGRDGIALLISEDAEAPGEFSYLVIDPQTWRVLAIEKTTTVSMPQFHVSAGSVTAYTLWP